MHIAARIARTIKVLDAISLWTGRLCGWIIIPLIAVMVTEICARYILHPTLWAFDTSYMLYGSLFMLGAAYTLSRGAHIRADFLYRMWSVRAQGTVDALLYLLLFFPGMGFFFWVGLEFTLDSWAQAERSVASAWMPPIYPLKTVLPVAAALLFIQGISEFLKSVYAAIRGEWLS